MPVLMSAVVYPGVGQFMQRRRVAAWLFVLIFSYFLGVCLIGLFVLGKVYLLNLIDGHAPEIPSFRTLSLPALCAAGIYLLNIADAYWAYLKR